MKWGFFDPPRGCKIETTSGLGAYLHPERVPRAAARGVAWRLLSREKGAFFAATPA